jgi:predicted protein tyrosine phosphatase
MGNKDDWPREKRWKDMYIRSTKVVRAKQLGFDYPRTTERQLIQEDEMEKIEERLKLLFVCSRNQWRSPTAEQIWRKHPKVLTRSGGTSPNARHTISVEDIRWANVIFVMEEKHKSKLVAEFTRLLANKPIHVLDIPDNYKFMDPELIEELELSVNQILQLE